MAARLILAFLGTVWQEKFLEIKKSLLIIFHGTTYGKAANPTQQEP
ncbi:hypothetical protein ACKF11_00880 [Methylobacillus sp. Pita2]|nr:hypothetical protein [Methylobacillus flagellatus]MDR5170482.1 hypothetical protein [Methylobacillus flagellatus]